MCYSKYEIDTYNFISITVSQKENKDESLNTFAHLKYLFDWTKEFKR